MGKPRREQRQIPVSPSPHVTCDWSHLRLLGSEFGDWFTEYRWSSVREGAYFEPFIGASSQPVESAYSSTALCFGK